jgi:long-chain acyl-CoA synthetase
MNTISDLVDEAAARFPTRAVLTVGGAIRSLAELPDLARGGARVLTGIGGRHVVYLAVSGPAFPLAMFAAARAGMAFTSMNYRLGATHLADLVATFTDPVVVADPEFAPLVKGVAAHVIETDAFCEQLVEAAGPFELPVADPSDPAVVLFTSGTTAAPKAVVLRHGTLHAYVSRSGALLPTGPGDTSVVSVPPYHITGVATVLNSMFVGRRMVFLPTFTPEGWLDLVRREGVTSGTLVPTMVARIVSSLDGHPADVPTLRALVYGGSKMPRSILERALRAFPSTDFVNGYGLTETSAGVTSLGPAEHREALASDDPVVRARLGSAGKPVGGAELQIRAADGTVLGPDEVGELWVRGPQVSGEYLGIGSVLDDDGWFPTRDRAHIDKHGYLFIGGRADDTIIRGGENIAPAEIEDVLDRHPAVHAVCVVGLPDEEWGERIAAVVVPAAETTAEELRAFVRQHLRGSRTPDDIVFRTDLPYTDSGKVQRRVLIAELTS